MGVFGRDKTGGRQVTTFLCQQLPKVTPKTPRQQLNTRGMHVHMQPSRTTGTILSPSMHTIYVIQRSQAYAHTTAIQRSQAYAHTTAIQRSQAYAHTTAIQRSQAYAHTTVYAYMYVHGVYMVHVALCTSEQSWSSN